MPTTLRLTTKLRKAVRFLRRNFPPKGRVRVQLVDKIDGLHGYCETSASSTLIRIAADDCEEMMNETLIEEWTHMIREGVPVPVEDDHDQIFWAILGKITMAWREKPIDEGRDKQT
jgi:hypothetical protein